MPNQPNPYATHKPPEGGGLYLKLKDGQQVSLRIASEAYVYQNKFQRGEEVQWSTRYAWVVYNNDEKKAQILQLSPRDFKKIAAYATDDEYGDPTEYNIRLAREGEGTNTIYTVIASPKRSPFTTEMGTATRKIDILSIPGLEHAIPISQLEDGSEAPKGAVDLSGPVSAGASKDVVIEDLEDDEPVNLDGIPFNGS